MDWSQSHCLSGLDSLYRGRHPLSSDPQITWGKTCHAEKKIFKEGNKKPQEDKQQMIFVKSVDPGGRLSRPRHRQVLPEPKGWKFDQLYIYKCQFCHCASIYPTAFSPSTTGDIQSVNTAHLHHTVSLSVYVPHCCETLWTFQRRLVFQQPPRLRTTVQMSQMSRDSWTAHSLSVKNKDRATRSRQGCPARSRGKLKSERERNLIIMHHWCESSTIKHSHDCSSRPDHKGELFLAFPTCYIWHLCFNN